MQILKVPFKIAPGATTTIELGSPSVIGDIVSCVVRCGYAPLRVVRLTSANIECLLPDDGITIDELATIPLKLPTSPAHRIRLELSGTPRQEGASGHALVVIHPSESRMPVTYAFQLVPSR
jgi:hypothetical protein